MEYSIIVPVLNEQGTLRELVDRCQAVFQKMGVSDQAEILFIDDGSTDETPEVLHRLALEKKGVRYIALRKNCGKALALMTGFLHTQSATIVTIDGDLQDQPEDIPLLIEKLKQGYDVVVGWKQNRQDGLVRCGGSKIINFLVSLIGGLPLHDFNCGLKVLRGEATKKLCLYGQYHRYISLLAHFQGFRVTEVPVRHQRRRFGQSRYPALRLHGVLDFISLLFIHKYGFTPLYFFGGFGALLAVPSAGVFCYVVMGRLSAALGYSHGWTAAGRFPLLLSFALVILGMNIFLTGFVCDFILYHQINNTIQEIVQSNIKTIA